MELLYAGDGILERVALARMLGHKEILVLFAKHEQQNANSIAQLPCGASAGILVTDLSQLRRVPRCYGAIIAPAQRAFAESKSVTHLLEPESGGRSDFTHHRNSGLNQVMLKLCARKRILTTLALLEKRPAVALGRMMQNARWCRKFGVPYEITSGARAWHEQRAAGDLQALHRELLRS